MKQEEVAVVEVPQVVDPEPVQTVQPVAKVEQETTPLQENPQTQNEERQNTKEERERKDYKKHEYKDRGNYRGGNRGGNRG